MAFSLCCRFRDWLQGHVKTDPGNSVITAGEQSSDNKEGRGQDESGQRQDESGRGQDESGQGVFPPFR